jgi:ATP-dependent DNA helicase RecG
MQSEIQLLDYLLTSLKDNSNRNEISYIELKENNTNPDKLGQSISAIANTCVLEKKENGYIIFGVSDVTLDELGVSFDPYNLKYMGNQDMEVYLRTMFVSTDFKFMPFKKNGKDFFIIEIYKALGSPSKFKNSSYIRIGKNTSDLKNHKDIEKRLWSSFESGYFWRKIAKEGLNFQEVLSFLDYDAYYQMLKIPIPSETEDIVRRFEQEEFVFFRNGLWSITNLGALLFAKDLGNFGQLKYKTPRVITYNGESKLDEVFKDQNGKKGFANGFEDLIKWIYSQIPEPEVITRIYREQKIIYPEKAIREIIANAIVHQDCEIDGMRPVIEIYKNRIEITSPGSCLVDEKRILDTVPKSRNEKMVDIMRRLHICEIRGSGIDRTIEEVEKIQLPAPKFENGSNFFKVYLFSYKPFSSLTTEEKLRALQQHIDLLYVQQQFANNESLRIRFGLGEKQISTISKLVFSAKEKNLIKVFDGKSSSKRYIKYIPAWA